MRPVTISLEGEWWDSLLYMGRWYLVGLDGTVRIIDWNRMIEAWEVEEDLLLPLYCAFARSDSLYGNRWRLVLGDPSIGANLKGKFERLAERQLTISKAQLTRYTIAH